VSSPPPTTPWTDSAALLVDPSALRGRFREDGFVCLRALVSTAPLGELAALVRKTLADQGLLGPDGLPTDRWRTDDPQRLAVHRAVLSSAATDPLRHDPALQSALECLLESPPDPAGGDVVRVRGPGDRTKPHQDRAYIALDPLLTVWLPLEPCSVAHGPLAVLAGSHGGGVLPHPAGPDAEAGVAAVPPGTWVSGSLNPGDAVIFDGLALHGALPTGPGRLRLSIDLRFAPAD